MAGKIIGHVIAVLLALLVCLGIPTVCYVNVSALFSEQTDAVSQASLVLPEQPSGEYAVFVNAEKFQDTKDQWKLFFSGEDAGVIFDDLNCLVMKNDSTGLKLAERFQARLPENQMKIRKEDDVLVASRAEAKMFDVVVMSKEMMDFYKLQDLCSTDGVMYISVKGE